MIRFFKRFFLKEKKEEIENIDITNLDSWFFDKKKNLIDNFEKDVDSFIKKINNEKINTIDNIQKLRTAQLQNPKITIREKQFMEGNRNAYTKRTEIFLKKLEIEEKGYDSIKRFILDFEKDLSDFSSSTFKAYQVLQHFFAHESRDIAINIKNFDNIVKDLSSFMYNNNLEKIDEIENKIKLLKNSIYTNDKNRSELNEKNKLSEDLMKENESLRNELENLKQSDEYFGYSSLLKEKNEIIKKLNEHKNKLIQPFSVLDHSLKKFSRMVFENEELLTNYIKNPIGAVFSDNDLIILKLLNNLKKEIINNKIDLKDKKKEKTLEEIEKLNKEFFENFINDYNEISDDLINIDNKINENKIKIIEKGLNEEFGNNNLKIEKINNEISNLKEDIEKNNIEKLKNTIEEEIKKVFKVEIKII